MSCCSCISSCCYSFFVEPLVEGKKHFGKAFKPIKHFGPEVGCCEALGRRLKGLAGRVSHFCAGILFMIPIFNKIFLVVKRCIYPLPSTNHPESSQPEAPRPKKVQSDPILSILPDCEAPTDYSIYEEYGTTWLNYITMHLHFQLFAHKYPNLIIQDVRSVLVIGQPRFLEGVGIQETDAILFLDEALRKAQTENKVVATYMRVSQNHWTLVFIDPQKKTIEYYDSMQKYGNHKQITAELENLANEHNFTFQAVIDRKIQNNGHDCGPYVIYFLEKRLEQLESNSSDLTTDLLAQGDMKNYRKILCQRKNALGIMEDRMNEEELVLFQKKYAENAQLHHVRAVCNYDQFSDVCQAKRRAAVLNHQLLTA